MRQGPFKSAHNEIKIDEFKLIRNVGERVYKWQMNIKRTRKREKNNTNLLISEFIN